MAKLTEYPQATSFDTGDILIKDGVNGTKKILVSDALKDKADITAIFSNDYQKYCRLLDAGENLDNLPVGNYYSNSQARSGSLINPPFSNNSFRMAVFNGVHASNNMFQVAVGIIALTEGNRPYSGIKIRRKIIRDGETTWSTWDSIATDVTVGIMIDNAISSLQTAEGTAWTE